jgi:hypothetical protein
MARNRPSGAVDTTMGPSSEVASAVAEHALPKGPPGLPVQADVDPWPIVSDPVQAAKEIEAGRLDQALVVLEHVAKTQSLTIVYAAAAARRKLLTGD